MQNKKLSYRRDSIALVAVMPFRVIQGHLFWYQSKVHMRLPISEEYSLTSSLAQFAKYHTVLIKLSLLTEGASL